MDTTKRKKRANKAASRNKCLLPGCERLEDCRGDCRSCYQMLQRAFKAGELTEEEAIEAGLILPARSKSQSPVSAAIKNLKKQKQKA